MVGGWPIRVNRCARCVDGVATIKRVNVIARAVSAASWIGIVRPESKPESGRHALHKKTKFPRPRYYCHAETHAWQALDRWFRREPGLTLARCESDWLREVSCNLFGYHLLQIGGLGEQDNLCESRIKHRIIVHEQAPGLEAVSWLRAEPGSLPIASESIDLVVLPHVLDFHPNPHGVLREVERVLIPEGHVIVLGFNPWSLSGLWRVALGWRGRIPWCGRFRGVVRIKDWLALLGFDSLRCEGLCFRPPLKHTGVMDKLRFLENLGEKYWPVFGGVYGILARKRVETLTPIKPRWRARRRLVGPLTQPGAPRAGMNGAKRIRNTKHER